MLTGNHDQVTLGGEQHALAPLAHCAREHVHVFAAPARWRNALWLPYRRDGAVLGAALRAAAAGGAGQGGSPLRAVFAHADVAGAQLNAAHQARSGLPPALFPPGVPVYSGHYHTPHTVAGTRITYVGSPYQVTAAEAGQPKRLLLLDADWALVGQLPLDIGPRHYALVGEAAATDIPAGLRRGDRIDWKLPPLPPPGAPPAPPPPSDAVVERLRAAGVRVDLLRPAAEGPRVRITGAHRLSPPALLQDYAEQASLSEQLRDACARFLEAGTARASGAGGGAGRPHVHFEPTALTLSGYGAFAQRCCYPLHNRGLVVLTGRVEGGGPGNAGDSNGCGKTTLAHAALWALTGRTQAGRSVAAGSERPTAALLVADGSREARVRLDALLNGQPFWAERCIAVGSGGAATSRFAWGLGGVDRTAQSMSLSEDALQSVLPVELLARTAFLGQNSTDWLLTCNDGEFKAALGHLTGADVWVAAAEAADAERKAFNAEAGRVGGALDALRVTAAAAAAEAEKEAASARCWAEEHESRSAAAAAEARKAARLEAAEAAALADECGRMRAALRACAPMQAAAAVRCAEAEAAAAEARSMGDSAGAISAEAVAAAEEVRDALAQQAAAAAAAAAAWPGVTSASNAVAVAEAACADAAAAQRAFNELLQRVGDGGASGGSCPSCAQPLGAQHSARHGEALAVAIAARDAQLAAATDVLAAAEELYYNNQHDAAVALERAAAAEARLEAARDAARVAALATERRATAAAEAARGWRNSLEAAAAMGRAAAAAAAEALAEIGVAPAPVPAARPRA
jgi:DNA repair exonuclease SbcCD ATPase subunit